MNKKEAKEIFANAFKQVQRAPKYVPTGIQDIVIKELGSGKWTVITDEKPNKVGKTCTGGVISRALIWPEDYADEYFPDPIYKNWPYPKRMCILASNENLQEGKPIREEITRWWPKARYREYKDGSNYIKRYETDTGWIISCYSFDQDRDKFEGPLFGFIWIDEVPKEWQISAMTSRLGEGGIILNTMTPINAALATKVYDDLQEQGFNVLNITCDVYQDDEDTGLMNRLGTKRGRRSRDKIDAWVSGIPKNERMSRVKGQRSGGGGLLHGGFNREAHVIEIDDFTAYRDAQHYMVIDPVGGMYYPFVQWWMVTTDNRAICYNEWPNKTELGDAYYDQIRTKTRCPYTMEQISEIMLILDFSQFGYKVRDRIVDPLFAMGSNDQYHRKSAGVIKEFMEASGNKICLKMAPVQKISQQTLRINELMEYNRLAPLSSMNRPRIQWASHCENSIRSASRVSFKEDSTVVDPTYKDPDDCTRYFLAFIGGDPVWQDINEENTHTFIGGFKPEGRQDLTPIGIG